MDESESEQRLCPVCHTEVYKEGTLYCSQACLHTWRGLRDHHVRKITERTCVICGTPFKLKSWSSRSTRTCSDRCSGLLRQRVGKMPLAPILEAIAKRNK